MEASPSRKQGGNISAGKKTTARVSRRLGFSLLWGGLLFGIAPLRDIGRLKPFRALDNFEVDVLAFFQCFEAVSLDGGEVNENIVTIRL